MSGLAGPRIARRELLSRIGFGLGSLALGSLSPPIAPGVRAADAARPLASRPPHFAPRAKHVIHLFMNGGPSQVDTFDPKPALAEYAGKSLPSAPLATERKTGSAYPSPFKFSRYGASGLEVSDLFPRVAQSADHLAVIRSMHADLPNHEPSLLLMNCGEARLIRPSMGSWVTYGLGTENENLPAFIVMCPGGFPIQGAENWKSGFLPGIHQGTYLDPSKTDVEDLIQDVRNRNLTLAEQRAQLDLVSRLNRRHLESRGADNQVEARIESFELAFRMQIEAADVFDTSREPQHVLDLYGPGTFARQALWARRLVERGVRFIQLWHGAGQPWDSHDNIEANHRRLAGECDQAIGALLIDLKARGLLDETLVLWGGEFGRTPTAELPAANGRDHNHYGFSVWMAGGGAKGGQAYGATDELGFRAVERPVHVHDLHATMLHLLGFDHERFTFRYAGRDFRLTDVHGRVIQELVA
jgi:hypothetical protein